MRVPTDALTLPELVRFSRTARVSVEFDLNRRIGRGMIPSLKQIRGENQGIRTSLFVEKMVLTLMTPPFQGRPSHCSSSRRSCQYSILSAGACSPECFLTVRYRTCD